MKIQLKTAIPSLLLTLLLLIFLEIVTSTIFPIVGATHFRLPFNILLSLYLGFRLNTPYLSVFIFILQYAHSLFSIEGWAIGTITGIFIIITIAYLKDLINLTSNIVTMIITEVFMLIWLMSISMMLYIKSVPSTYIIDKAWRFVPESLLVAFLSPFIFSLLDKIWNYREEGELSS